MKVEKEEKLLEICPAHLSSLTAISVSLEKNSYFLVGTYEVKNSAHQNIPYNTTHK
jgi:hypothetical protein